MATVAEYVPFWAFEPESASPSQLIDFGTSPLPEKPRTLVGFGIPFAEAG
jgi:hypothetical protein